MEPARFPIRIGRRSRPIVRLFTATPATAYVDVGEEFEIRFGRFRFGTPVHNIAGYRVEGPFTWIKAIGVRRGVLAGDVSFCGSSHGAVRINLKEPQPWGPFKVPTVWAGADDLEALAAELTRRQIAGDDVRHRRA